MEIRTGVWALVLIIAASSTALQAQEVVRLKSGRILSGTVRMDESIKDGFTVALWETGGSVFVRWTQVSEHEKRRLQGKGASVVALASGDLLDGVRVITANREVIGLLSGTSDSLLQIKTASSIAPVSIPRSAVLRQENLRIAEADAYSPEEMVERRLTGSPDASRLIETARFAAALKLFGRAKELLARVSASEPDRKNQVDTIIEDLDRQALEAAAELCLAAIRKLQDETRYAQAIESAEKFLADFAATEAARQNKDLVARLTADKKVFDQKRDEILGAKIPELWRNLRSTLVTRYADRRYRLGESRSAIDRLDEELAKGVSEKVGCTEDEARSFWSRREQKAQTPSMGSGSWIFMGGQDGGLDYTASVTGGGRPGKDEDPVDDLTRSLGGRSGDGPKKKPQDTASRLQTSDEWWASASSSLRRDWLLAYYASMSAHVTKVREDKDKDCSACGGKGTLKATRAGKIVDVICHRCHGSKKDYSVTFW